MHPSSTKHHLIWFLPFIYGWRFSRVQFTVVNSVYNSMKQYPWYCRYPCKAWEAISGRLCIWIIHLPVPYKAWWESAVCFDSSLFLWDRLAPCEGHPSWCHACHRPSVKQEKMMDLIHMKQRFIHMHAIEAGRGLGHTEWSGKLLAGQTQGWSYLNMHEGPVSWH